MACRFFGAKPLSRPTMTSYKSHPREQTSMEKIFENLPTITDDTQLKDIVRNFTAIFFGKSYWNV